MFNCTDNYRVAAKGKLTVLRGHCDAIAEEETELNLKTSTIQEEETSMERTNTDYRTREKHWWGEIPLYRGNLGKSVSATGGWASWTAGVLRSAGGGVRAPATCRAANGEKGWGRGWERLRITRHWGVWIPPCPPLPNLFASRVGLKPGWGAGYIRPEPGELQNCGSQSAL